MPARPAAWAALAALMSAGCIAPASVEPSEAALPPAPLDLALPFVLKHDHESPDDHAGVSGGGLDVVAALGLADGIGTVGELDLAGDHLFLAALRGGFLVYDISDRATPSLVTAVELPQRTYGADLKVTPDGTLVMLGVQGFGGGSSGVQLWDVTDKASPRFLSETPVPVWGCHMLAYKEIAGGRWIFCAGNEGVRILELRDVAGTLRAIPTSIYAFVEKPMIGPEVVPYLPWSLLWTVPGTHDMTVQDDPLTGAPVMTVSAWGAGVRIVDVSDPRRPKELGAWNGQGAETFDGGTHTSMLTEVDGRRIAVTSPEYSKVPAITILDATDLTDIEVLAEWTAVDDYGDDPTLFSTHNFQIVDGRIVLAQYHGGVWILDISTPERLADPQAVGYSLPAGGALADDGPFADEAPQPITWDVVVKDGTVYASDIASGLYVLEHPSFRLGDAALTSFG